MTQKEICDVALTLLGETPRAFKVTEGKPEDAFWLPKSVVEHDGKGTFTMPIWLASKKELAGY